jgi:hypothetical protein
MITETEVIGGVPLPVYCYIEVLAPKPIGIICSRYSFPSMRLRSLLTGVGGAGNVTTIDFDGFR